MKYQVLHDEVAAAKRAQRASKRAVFFLALLAFPLFLSVDLDNFSIAFDRIVTAWKILSAVIIGFLFVNRLLGKKPTSTHIVPMVLLIGVLAISTQLNEGSLSNFVVIWGGFFAVCVLVEATIQERPSELLLALKIVLGTLVVANCMTVLAMPDGLWRSATEGNWLFGHRNNFGTPIIAALIVSAMSDLVRRTHISLSTLAIAVASFVSVIRTWSATSVVITVLTIAAILFVFYGRGLSRLRPPVLLTLYALIDIGIVFFHIQDRWDDFIENVLERSADLTGRTRLWGIVREKIAESPVWGHGVQTAENNELTSYNENFVHAHNGELDIIYTGGAIAFVFFVVLVFWATKRATEFYSSRIVQLLYIGLIFIMFRAITGLFFSSYACLLVYLLLNAEKIAALDKQVLPHRPSDVTSTSSI